MKIEKFCVEEDHFAFNKWIKEKINELIDAFNTIEDRSMLGLAEYKERKDELMKIYVIFGATGEYSDRDEWIIKAYKNKEMAKSHLLNADKRAKELFKKYEDEPWNCKEENIYDPAFRMYYTGTQYYILQCEIEE